MWHYSEQGSGAPLVLLHGIGMSHAAWNPVMPYLASMRRVIAFDIAGFGLTPSLPVGTPPTIPNLVEDLERSLREIGIDMPVDIAGNSLGGLMALEAAKRGIARSAVVISPPGLWKGHRPRHVKYAFASMRFIVRNFPRFSKFAMRMPLMRELLLAIPVSIGSRRMPVEDAIRATEDLANATAFEETFENTRNPFSGCDITCPVTIVFGDRDWILPRRSRHRHGLPPHARWIEKPYWGHVPMWLDPEGVARMILAGIE